MCVCAFFIIHMGVTREDHEPCIYLAQILPWMTLPTGEHTLGIKIGYKKASTKGSVQR